MESTNTPNGRRVVPLRRTLGERLLPELTAWSIDGLVLGMQGAVEDMPPPGSYFRVRTGRGVYVAQSQGREMVDAAGVLFEFLVDQEQFPHLDDAQLQRFQVTANLRLVEGSGALIGRLDGDGIVATTITDAFGLGSIEPATDDDIVLALGHRLGKGARLEIGALASAPHVPATLSAKGFARHTFLCGQSGSGKTYTLGKVLEQVLIKTSLQIVILDPNSDHVHINELRDDEELFASGLVAAPEEVDALREQFRAAGSLVVARAEGVDGGNAVLRVRFSDLTLAEQGLVLRLDPLDDREEFHLFKSIVERLSKTTYSVDDVVAELQRDSSEHSIALRHRIENLGVAAWGVWADADESSVADIPSDQRRVLVLDLGSLDDVAERQIIATALLGTIRRRSRRTPVLLVVDEAHNICPAEPDSLMLASMTDHMIWIAGEGRKYGVHMLVATQRPQKLHTNVLSQCDNLLLLRMNSLDDANYISRSLSHVPAAMIADAPHFRMGEVLAAGPIAPDPIRLRTGPRATPEGGGDVGTNWADG